MLIVIVLVVVFLLFLILYKKFKHLKLPTLCLVTGGVKTGKTTLGVHLCIKQHKKVIRSYFIRKYVRAIFTFGKAEKEEMPLLYSNMPIMYKYYVPLKKEHILRQERFNYKSVVYISEASLMADSMMTGDLNLNEQSLLFNKLIGHELKGGFMLYDTQCLSDNHFSVKRCLNSYLWIHSSIKIPFFIIMKVRECIYSYDNSSINTFDDDVDKSLYTLIVPKKVWKQFDCYCYSCLTDHLPHPYELIKKDNLSSLDLKAHNIISFKKFNHLKGQAVPDNVLNVKGVVKNGK